jgi:N-formylglutamate deformylase
VIVAKAIYEFTSGNSPVIISMPHSGTVLAETMHDRMTSQGKALIDTDWHIPMLYEFAREMGVSTIRANYSRYVVDLNRPVGGGALYAGQSETQICPTSTFMDHKLYVTGQEPSEQEIANRVENYWVPYHQRLKSEIEKIKKQHGYALLWDAHSIQSKLPRFFEGALPNLNLGTASGASCDPLLRQQLSDLLDSTKYKAIVDGRFKGGYITRNYGNPDDRVHAVQMEIAQSTYMTEYPCFEYDHDSANKLKPVLKMLVDRMLAFTPSPL